MADASTHALGVDRDDGSSDAAALTAASALADGVLVLGAIVLAIVAISSSAIFFYFGDIILVFFLAWLLAFIISPVVSRPDPAHPASCRGSARSSSSTDAGRRRSSSSSSSSRGGARPVDHRVRRAASRTSGRTCPRSSRRGRSWLDSLGLGQVDLVAQAESCPRQPRRRSPRQLVAPLQQIAVASLGAVGNAADRLLPVDLHGRRPRRRSWPSCSGSSRRATRGGAPARDVASRARSAASCAARRSWASSTSRSRLATNLAARAAARGRSRRSRPAAPDDPVLRPVRVVGAAGHRRARPPARARRCRR